MSTEVVVLLVILAVTLLTSAPIAVALGLTSFLAADP